MQLKNAITNAIKSSKRKKRTNASSDDFKIIDSNKFFLKLKIKEGFHITTGKPELNVQVKHFKTSLI